MIEKLVETIYEHRKLVFEDLDDLYLIMKRASKLRYVHDLCNKSSSGSSGNKGGEVSE